MDIEQGKETTETKELTAQDILNKSTETKETPKEGETGDVNLDDLKEDMNLESITDPVARRVAKDKITNLEKGFNKKYESISHLKRELEADKAKLTQELQANQSWNQDRFNKTIADPQFVELAKQAQTQQAPQNFQGSSEEWSAMSEGEQGRFKAMETEILQMKQSIAQDKSKLEVERLKEKYKSFDEARLNSFVSDVESGKYRPTQEDAWKIVNYEDAVKHGYQMGLDNLNQGISDKMNASGINGNINVSPSSGDIPEDVMAAFKKGDHGSIGRWRMNQKQNT